MHEVEIKILDIDVDAFSKRILSRGATDHGEQFYDAWIYDTPGEEIKKRGGILRLRTSGNKTTLTLKEATSYTGTLKVLEEHETTVEDPETMRTILEKLGYQCVMVHQKYRHTYRWRDLEIVVDRYPDMPPYVELEGPEAVIMEVLEELELPISLCSKYSAMEVMRHYGVDPTRRVFSQ